MNKYQLCLILDRIDPRYIDEASAYRGRSAKKAARTLLIAAAIALLAALFSIGAISAFRSASLGYGEFLRPGAPSFKEITLADGTALSLTYDHSIQPKVEVPYKPTYDIYLHGRDEYQFDLKGRLISFSNLNRTNNSEPPSEPGAGITREQAIEIAEAHLRAYYGIPPEYRLDHCSYDDQIYFITYAWNMGQNGFIEADYAAVFIDNNGTVTASKAPRPHRLEGFDEARLAALTPEDLEAYVEEQILAQYGEYSCIACNLADAYLQEDEEGNLRLIAYARTQIRGQGLGEREYVYPLD